MRLTILEAVWQITTDDNFWPWDDAQLSIFDEIQGVWIADETLFGVFDISSQSKEKLKSKRRSKMGKIYAN